MCTKSHIRPVNHCHAYIIATSAYPFKKKWERGRRWRWGKILLVSGGGAPRWPTPTLAEVICGGPSPCKGGRGVWRGPHNLTSLVLHGGGPFRPPPWGEMRFWGGGGGLLQSTQRGRRRVMRDSPTRTTTSTGGGPLWTTSAKVGVGRRGTRPPPVTEIFRHSLFFFFF